MTVYDAQTQRRHWYDKFTFMVILLGFCTQIWCGNPKKGYL